MLTLFHRGMLVMGIAMTAAACEPAPTGYGNPSYNNGYYSPAPAPSQYGYAQPAQYGYAQPAQYGYAQPAPYYYAQQQGNRGYYNQGDGRGYANVTVTNRGQNGNRDDVVQQQVACGSQYYDGYRTRTAPRC